MCNKIGAQLGAGDDLLHRQVIPEWLDGGEPSSQAFYPWRDIDDGCLSVDRGALATPADAFALFTSPQPAGFGRAAAEVWSLSRAEIEAQTLTAWEDPVAQTATTPANPSHAIIEFGAHDRKKWKGVGKKLKVSALARGRQHP